MNVFGSKRDECSAGAGEGSEQWRGLRATFPSEVASHSTKQDFYFGEDGLLRRHDYHVDASGGFAAAQYVHDIIETNGIKLPTKRRAYMRDENLLPIFARLMVSIDISAVSITQRRNEIMQNPKGRPAATPKSMPGSAKVRLKDPLVADRTTEDEK